MKVAKNGNASGPNDPDFIHFSDEQSGVLLPSCPGYPDWLPQLQLTLKGRLCFWNFPAWIYKVDCNKSGTEGTSQWLRDQKAVKQPLTSPLLKSLNPSYVANVSPPIPADRLGTNGPSNQYFWGACNTMFLMTAEIRKVLGDNMGDISYTLSETSPYSQTKGKYTRQQMRDQFNLPQGPDNQYLAMVNVGSPMPNPIYPMDWIAINVQYYLGRYLNMPYDFNNNDIQYAKSWRTILETASKRTDLNGWLSVIDFLREPQADPSTWDKVSAVLPTAILSIVGGVIAVASLGAATPALVAAVGAMAKAGQKASAADAQNSAQLAYDQLNAGANLQQVSADVAALNPVTGISQTEKNYIFFGLLALVILIVVLFKKK